MLTSPDDPAPAPEKSPLHTSATVLAACARDVQTAVRAQSALPADADRAVASITTALSVLAASMDGLAQQATPGAPAVSRRGEELAAALEEARRAGAGLTSALAGAPAPAIR